MVYYLLVTVKKQELFIVTQEVITLIRLLEIQDKSLLDMNFPKKQ